MPRIFVPGGIEERELFSLKAGRSTDNAAETFGIIFLLIGAVANAVLAAAVLLA